MSAEPPRLSSTTLSRLAPEIQRPGYPRDEVVAGIVHLGLGAFHRAHQAVVFDSLIAQGDLSCGVRGVSLRSAAVRDQLAPQDGLYSVMVRDGADERVKVVGAIGDVLVAPQDPLSVVEALAGAAVHTVTLTITEKGYDPGDEADGPLAPPRTAVDVLVAGLALRRARGLEPFTVLSCDNLAANGRKLEALVLGRAERRDPHLRDWIQTRAAFPDSMVDRIVPATTPAEIDAFAQRFGLVDAGLVITEPYFQWVIEDQFTGRRPDFAKAGVQLAPSIAPFERAKLRLLDGAHSATAYLGGLAGFEYVSDFVGWRLGQVYIERLWDEIAPTVGVVAGLDLTAYRQALMARFLNSALRHRCRQIAMDGSKKLPQRLLAPLTERLARDQPVDALALAVAGWMRWQSGMDDKGVGFTVEDPNAAWTRRAYDGGGSAVDRVRALLGAPSLDVASLGENAATIDLIAAHLDRLERMGAVAALAGFMHASADGPMPQRGNL